MLSQLDPNNFEDDIYFHTLEGHKNISGESDIILCENGLFLSYIFCYVFNNVFLCYRIEMSQQPNFNQQHQVDQSQMYQSSSNSCYFGMDATIPMTNQRVAMVPIPDQPSTHLLDSGLSGSAAQTAVFGLAAEYCFRTQQKNGNKNQYSNYDSFNFYNSNDGPSLMPNSEKSKTDAKLDSAHSIDVANYVTNVAKSLKKQHECVI